MSVQQVRALSASVRVLEVPVDEFPFHCPWCLLIPLPVVRYFLVLIYFMNSFHFREGGSKLPRLYTLPICDFELRATHARTLLPAALASVSFGFVLVRVRVRIGTKKKADTNERTNH